MNSKNKIEKGKLQKSLEKKRKQSQTLFLWAPKSRQMVSAAMKLEDAGILEEKLWPT